MTWQRKLKKTVLNIPDRVSANEVISQALGFLRQRACYGEGDELYEIDQERKAIMNDDREIKQLKVEYNRALEDLKRLCSDRCDDDILAELLAYRLARFVEQSGSPGFAITLWGEYIEDLIKDIGENAVDNLARKLIAEKAEKYIKDNPWIGLEKTAQYLIKVGEVASSRAGYPMTFQEGDPEDIIE